MSRRRPHVLRAARWHTLPGWLAPAAACLWLALPAGSAKTAEPDPHYNGAFFTPQLSFGPSTAKAGASPDLTIQMEHPADHCLPPILQETAEMEACEAAYIEQNLKDWTIHLPAGMMADSNAVPQCADPGPHLDEESYYGCPSETEVGDLTVTVRPCDWNGAGRFYMCTLLDYGRYPGYIGGKVYNAKPGPNEQGHLYVLIGLWDSQHDTYNFVQRVDASVRLRSGGDSPDYGIDSITIGIPDALCADPTQEPCRDFYLGLQAYRIKLTLLGQKGQEQGHPLLRNPTFCSPAKHGSPYDGVAGSDFVGYAQNAWKDAYQKWYLGFGDGLSVQSAVPYQVTGCGELAFDPGFELSASPDTPGAAPALTAAVTQADGEQTIGEVRTRFPRGFKVNFDNKLRQCADEQIAARACPEGSRIGVVEAKSPLLPLTGEFAGPLRGDAYIGQAGRDAIKVVAFLHGFADVTISGTLRVNEDGTSEAVFSNLPSIPMTRFVLSLLGGDHALLTNPATCGQKTIEATFTSHQGRQVKRAAPLDIACAGADFDVTLGSRRPGAHPTATLISKAPGARSVAFDLSRYLRVGSRASKLQVFRRYGTLTLSTDKGPRELPLKLLKRGTFGSLRFSATEAGAQVSPLSAYDVRLEGKSKKRAAKHGRRGKGPTRLVVDNLPKGTTVVSLELEGSKDDLIQNPSSCRGNSPRSKRRALGFAARITGTEGQHQIFHRVVKLVCAKQRRG